MPSYLIDRSRGYQMFYTNTPGQPLTSREQLSPGAILISTKDLDIRLIVICVTDDGRLLSTTDDGKFCRIYSNYNYFTNANWRILM